MKDIFRLRTLAAAGTIALLTAACGSSDDSAPPPTVPLPPTVPAPPPPPDTMAQEDAAASASVAGLIAFIQAIIASMTMEANEPRSIGGITPPVSEADEPASI